jgi:hypothetical protein
MPEWILPATFVSVLAEMRPCFTGPSFDSFRVLVAGWVHALGKHRVSDVIRASGALATKHYSAYYRLLSRAHWSLDALGLRLLGVVLQWLGIDEVELVLDDTLCVRSGKKVSLASMHADSNRGSAASACPILSNGPSRTATASSVSRRSCTGSASRCAWPTSTPWRTGPCPGGCRATSSPWTRPASTTARCSPARTSPSVPSSPHRATRCHEPRRV